jgi:transcriptional regulator with XRE-family HTH domain
VGNEDVGRHLAAIGDRLRLERLRLGKNIDEMAEITGAHRNSIANYEKAERQPNTAFLLILRDIGVDIAYVLTGERADSSLSAEHTNLIDMFDQLSSREKNGIMAMIMHLTGSEPLILGRMSSQHPPSLHSPRLEYRIPKKDG